MTNNAARRPLPLRGVRILEAGTAVAIPLASRVLADFGAEVIKVESAVRPELGRVSVFANNAPGERYWETGGFYAEINRNKLGVSLDLSKPDGRAVFLDLVALSDVVVENYTPRVMANFRLDYPHLVERRPDIIMVSATGFGHTGPWRNYRAYGFTLEPTSGITAGTGYPGEAPLRTTITYTDTPAAYLAGFAALAALEHRAKTGRGQWIDLAQYEVGATLATEGTLAWQASGQPPERLGNRAKEFAPRGVYPCLGDDQWLALTVRDDQDWQRLCQAIGRPDLANAKAYRGLVARKQRELEIDEVIASWSRTRSGREAMKKLQEAQIPAGLVLDNRELLLDPHLNERGFFSRLTHPLDVPGMGTRIYPGPPMVLDGDRPPAGPPAPTLGQDTDTVLSSLLGLRPADLDRLAVAGISGTVPDGAGASSRRRYSTYEDLIKTGEIREYDPDYRHKLGI